LIINILPIFVKNYKIKDMDFFETVKKRKAVRHFLPQKIDREKIEEILKAVNLAPSAGNIQAYKIYVVEDEAKIKTIANACLGQSFIAEAPVVFIFCANPQESAAKYGKRGEELYNLQDATIATSYATLAITALGLSSCWVGAFNEKEIQTILNTNLRPVAVIPVGQPAEEPSRRKRKNIEEIAEFV